MTDTIPSARLEDCQGERPQSPNALPLRTLLARRAARMRTAGDAGGARLLEEAARYVKSSEDVLTEAREYWPRYAPRNVGELIDMVLMRARRR